MQDGTDHIVPEHGNNIAGGIWFTTLEPAGKFPRNAIINDRHSLGARIETGDSRKMRAAVVQKIIPVFEPDFFERFKAIG